MPDNGKMHFKAHVGNKQHGGSDEYVKYGLVFHFYALLRLGRPQEGGWTQGKTWETPWIAFLSGYFTALFEFRIALGVFVELCPNHPFQT